jgi:hypothetical protein
MKGLAALLGCAVLVLPAAAVAQQGKGAGNAAKAQACRAEASRMVTRVSSKRAGSNVDADRAQARVYYQQCMAR